MSAITERVKQNSSQPFVVPCKCDLIHYDGKVYYFINLKYKHVKEYKRIDEDTIECVNTGLRVTSHESEYEEIFLIL